MSLRPYMSHAVTKTATSADATESSVSLKGSQGRTPYMGSFWFGYDEASAVHATVRVLDGQPATLAEGTVSAAEVRIQNFESVFAFTPFRRNVVITDTEHAFTATTHDIADPDTDPREKVYVLSVARKVGHAPDQATEVVTITGGTIAAAGLAVAPATPAGEIKIGEVLIQHDGTAIFNATTDLLTAAHLTVTFTPTETVLAQYAHDFAQGGSMSGPGHILVRGTKDNAMTVKATAGGSGEAGILTVGFTSP